MCFVPYEGNSGRFIPVPYASCTSVIPEEGLGSIYRVFFYVSVLMIIKCQTLKKF